MQDVVDSISDFLATVVSILTLPLKPPNLYRVWMKCNGKHSIFYYYCYYDWQEYVYLNTNTKVKGKPGVSNFKCDDVDTVLSHDLWGKITHRNPNINHFVTSSICFQFPVWPVQTWMNPSMITVMKMKLRNVDLFLTSSVFKCCQSTRDTSNIHV